MKNCFRTYFCLFSALSAYSAVKSSASEADDFRARQRADWRCSRSRPRVRSILIASPVYNPRPPR